MKLTFLLSLLLFGRTFAQNVVNVAVNAPDLFSTLLELVIAGGLDDTLRNADDITVFAPTNEAFAKLHQGSINLLRTEPWKPHLQNLLLQHILPIEVPSSNITDGLTATALNEEEIKLTLPATGGVVVNDVANVTQAVIQADNGVIHAVDTVIFPEWVFKSIFDRVNDDQELRSLLYFINGLRLDHVLTIRGPFTVFAPTDEAFREGLRLLGAQNGVININLAVQLLTNHVVYGVYPAEAIEEGFELITVNGEFVKFSFSGEVPRVNDANIVSTDILANNGIVHKIDGLLIPEVAGPAPNGTIVDTALDNSDDLSLLLRFVTRADLSTSLATTQGLTVFAPTNDAFVALISAAPSVAGNLFTDEWATHLKDLLLYHVLPTEVPSSFLTNVLTATALNGEELSFTVNEDGIFVNTDSEVILADITASNGVIHGIDRVLTPSWFTNSIVDRAIGSPSLTTLVDLVLQADLAEALSGEGPFTVFAPTNDAFLQFLGEGDDLATLDMDLVSSILRYHVVPGIHPASEITNGLSLPTLHGENVTFSSMGSTSMANGQNIILTDILANNGIVHLIDGVLIPTTTGIDAQNVVDVVVNNPNTFSTFLDFVVLAGFVEPLANTQGITVFAPTNDGFALLANAAPSVVANLQTDEWGLHLKDFLLHHILLAEVPSNEVTDGLTVTTLNDEAITFTVNENGIFIDPGFEVILPDVEASNGVIHVVDRALIPSWITNSIVDRAVGSPSLTTLVDLVTQAGLVDTLSGDGPFTVFAPTNEAFLEFLDGTPPSLLDIDLVSSILTYHVVPGIYSTNQITNGLTLTTVQGENILFSIMGGTTMVNRANIIATDILANNGIVHFIDGVLIPLEVTAPVVMEAAVAQGRYGSTITMTDSEEASSASFYRKSFAAVSTALVGFWVAIGAVL